MCRYQLFTAHFTLLCISNYSPPEDKLQPKRVCHGEPGSLGLIKWKMDHSKKLPQGWEKSVAVVDREWIGQALFRKKGELVAELKNWWYPPEVNRLSSSSPVPLLTTCRGSSCGCPGR